MTHWVVKGVLSQVEQLVQSERAQGEETLVAELGCEVGWCRCLAQPGE